MFAFVRSRVGALNLAAGALLLPLALAAIATLLAPGVSMLFVWPSIFAAVALHWLVARRQAEVFSVVDLAFLALCAAAAILVFFPLVWAVYIGFSIAGAPALATAVLLMFALIVPLFEMTARAHKWWLPATASVLAVVFTVVGVLGARPGPDRPVPEDLVYVLDRDAREAFWATQTGGGVWLPRFFDGATTQATLNAFLVREAVYRLAPAPLIDFARTDVTVLSDNTNENLRNVRVEIRPGLAPELVSVAPAAGSSRLLVVNGTAVRQATSADRPNWQLQHFGRPPNGALVLDLEIEGDGPIELIVVEGVMRLPDLPGVERPPEVTPHASRPTDMSLFRQIVRIE
jgi:hypothetical protein